MRLRPNGTRRRLTSALTTGAALAAFYALPIPDSRFPIPGVSRAQAQAPRGKAVYDKWCAGCHGDKGAGDGPGAKTMLPHPRDFTKGVYKVRTTASGELPTDADMLRIVAEGMPGSAMPEWKSRLSETERADVVDYIKSFSSFFKGAKPKLVTIGKAPSSSAQTIAEGRETFKKLECFKCHGQDARGDGTSAPKLKDDYDAPIRAADLTQRVRFRGGATVEDIYSRLRTGLDGTPMPSFTDAVESKVVSDEQLWHVAQYVNSLSSAGDEVREVVRAAAAEGALPASPNDSAWSKAERFWIPLVGQIVTKPREFAPTVSGVWVQALHDASKLTVRLTWHDPSKSPDPTWDEWLGRMSKALTDADGALPTAQSPDRLTVEFSPNPAEETERPYFLGGNNRRPVYVWRWTSTPDEAQEGTQRGLGKFSARAGATALTHAAVYDNGEWRVQFTRPLASTDATAPPFTLARAIPIGFTVSDGSSGEDEVRAAISTWYAIYLDVPTPPRVFIAPAATMLLTAGLGFLVVMQAQRRERGARDSGQEE
jgi:DMSO reductase family type II enzyme heme b subunit